MIRVLVFSVLLCWFFIELQILHDPMQNLSNEFSELKQSDSDDLDFSNNFNESDLLFFQTLPKTELNPGFVFLVQSVLESLRRNQKVHFLFYQSISYSRWRELFRHCFLRLYRKDIESDSTVKFVFAVPLKVFTKLDTKFELPSNLEAGKWQEVLATHDVFDKGLPISHSQEFLYLTNDPEAPFPKVVKNASRKQVLLQYSSELIPFIREIYPSKRRKKNFTIQLMDGKIEATKTKVMIM